MLKLVHRSRRFDELSYANAGQPRMKRWFIRAVEGLSGRERFAALYEIWKRDIVPTGDAVFTRMLDLIDVRLDVAGSWPPPALPEGPLVLMANHPFGIGDGIAILSLAERLGRPFKVLINAELLKVPEMAAWSLPVDFSETKEALKANMAVRHEALRLLRQGVTIVVFPAGGVATAPSAFAKAEDLPWKVFPARLVQEAGASVVPIFFQGQNGPLFHIASRVSLTARLSLLLYEFARLSGKSISVRIGRVIAPEETLAIRDRKSLMEHLRREVFSLEPAEMRRRNRLRLSIPRRRDRAAA